MQTKTKAEKKPAKAALPPKPLYKADKAAQGERTTRKAATAAPKPAKPRAAASAKAKSTPAGARKPRDVKKDGAQTKRSIAAALIARPEGATLKDVLAATGWPSVSMLQLAASSNLELRKEKEKGSPTRYFGTAI